MVKAHVEIIRWGLLLGFLKERGNFVVYLGPFLIAITW